MSIISWSQYESVSSVLSSIISIVRIIISIISVVKYYQLVSILTWDMLMFSALSIAPGTSYLGWRTNCQTIIEVYLILLITNVNCSFVGKKRGGLVLSLLFGILVWYYDLIWFYG